MVVTKQLRLGKVDSPSRRSVVHAEAVNRSLNERIAKNGLFKETGRDGIV